MIAALTSACTSVPVCPHPRPAQPIPRAVAARYDLPGPLVERSFVPIGSDGSLRYARGRLEAGDEVSDIFFIQPAGDGPFPFVLLLPILAGGQELMWLFGQDLAARGYAVGWSRRVASALTEDQRSVELEGLFRRSIIQARMLLAWSRRQPQIDRTHAGLVGFSLGSMIGSAVLALEQELRGGVLCLAGGDLADILMVSAEPRAVRWRGYRFEGDGIGSEALERALRSDLVSDPARLARYVDTEKVLLVSARFDDVVPMRNQDLLWESLGRPRRMLVPLGHYTAALAIGRVLDAADEFLR